MRKDISSLFTKILDRLQRKTFDQLKALGEFGYLAGGTALALQLGHRKSFDLDMFSNEKMSLVVREKVVKVFGEKVRFTMDTDDQLTWLTNNQVKITLAYTPYRLLHPKVKTTIVDLGNVKDIASDKAFTVGRRGEYRDYVDLMFILKSGVKLETIIQEAQHRYRAMFDEKLFLEQLDYLDDLTNFTIDFIADPVTPDQVKDFLHHQIKAYLASQKITA